MAHFLRIIAALAGSHHRPVADGQIVTVAEIVHVTDKLLFIVKAAVRGDQRFVGDGFDVKILSSSSS